MSSLLDKIRRLTLQLYPTGRAFYIPVSGVKDKMHKALATVEAQALSDANSTLFSILPDNDNFTSDDATLWEQRLGLITNEAVSLTDRKAAIIRKMNHPGSILARQSRDYIESQLQLAGFNVFVHENIPDTQILAISGLMGIVQSGQFQSGQIQSGQKIYSNKVVNNIDRLKDVYYLVGNDNKSVFFIGGEVFPNLANVDQNREAEFRQLILKLKPVQTVGYLLINYV
jgi:uncharacterized protein YmfQ (DUF2313 family)